MKKSEIAVLPSILYRWDWWPSDWWRLWSWYHDARDRDRRLQKLQENNVRVAIKFKARG